MRIISTLLCLLFVSSLVGQNKKYFAQPINSFSKKKISHLTLTDGSQLDGKLKKVKRKKMLFETITIIDEDGKKHKLAADQIKSMYLPQSGWDKFVKINDVLNDATEWNNTELNQQYINDGYAYFESAEVYYKKKKKKVLLLQLLNPSFSGKVKVFHDPLAYQTASMSVGGLKVAGGDLKSYFIKVGNKVAYKLKKKKYKDSVDKIIVGCSEYTETIDKTNWNNFGEVLKNVTKNCQ